MNSIIKNLSIKYKIFFSISILLILFIIWFSVSEINGIKNDRIKISISNQYTLALSLKNEIDMAMKNTYSISRTVTLMSNITEMISKNNYNSLKKVFPTLNIRLNIKNIYYYSSDLKNFVSNKKIKIKRKYNNLSDIGYSNADGSLVIYAVAPVVIKNKTVGYIVAENDLKQVFKNIFNRFKDIEWDLFTSEFNLSEEEKKIIAEIKNSNEKKSIIKKDKNKIFIDMYIPFFNKNNKYLFSLKYSKESEIKKDEEAHTISRIIRTSIIAMIISFFLSLFLTKYFLSQIEKIKSQVEAMIKGEFVSHQYTAKDEFGQMGNLMNQMVKKVHTSLLDLTESKEELQSIFSHIADGILVIDNNGEIVTYNNSFVSMFELSKVELKHYNNIIEYIQNLVLDKNSLEVFLGSFTKQEYIESEVELNIKDDDTDNGTNKIITFTATPLLNTESIYSGKVFSFHDSTSARNLDRMKSDFVANVAHELRTPLTVIKGFVDLITNEKYSKKIKKAEREEYHQMIKMNITRLTKMINDLLDLSKMEARQMEMAFYNVNLFQTVENTYKSFLNISKEREIKLILNVPGNLPNVAADVDRISQVFYNLIYNAIKFTEKDGSIEIKSETIEVNETKYLKFSVIDTGKGIEKENLERIFDKFKQIGKQKEGSGLGLSIAKTIIELHYGKIWAESPPAGREKGTSLNFILPIKDLTDLI